MASRDSGFDPLRLDIEAFAAEQGELDGRWPLRDLPRVLESMAVDVAQAGDECVDWKAAGLRSSRSGAGQTWLHLDARARAVLQCQRCLAPMPVPLAVERRIRFVHGEEAAAQLDAGSEEDVLAMTRALDLRELVEDELLLAMPLVPLHDVCPDPLPVPVESDTAVGAPNPFAVLAALKRPDREN